MIDLVSYSEEEAEEVDEIDQSSQQGVGSWQSPGLG